jgi:hypothetical protein
MLLVQEPKMKPTVLLLLAILLPIYVSSQTAQQSSSDKYAPLPDQIVKAKTVFLTNETGKARFGDAVYKQIKTWNRWQVVTDKTQADIVLVLSDKGGASSMNPSYYLTYDDPKTGNELWKSRTTMEGKLWRSWDSVAETLVKDIRKRL